MGERSKWCPGCYETPTDVVGEEVGGETLGAVAEGRVVVRVPAKDEQRAAEQRGRVQVPREAALPQDEPGAHAGQVLMDALTCRVHRHERAVRARWVYHVRVLTS